MKFIIFGLVYTHILVISGQLTPYALHYNQSSSGLLKRSLRSTGLKMNAAEPKCHGCDDDNAEQERCGANNDSNIFCFQFQGQCTNKQILRAKRYIQRLKCLPEGALIRLEPPAPYYSVEPSMARVNRCNGYCKFGFHKCLAIQTSSVKIPAILTNHAMKSYKCVEYEVEQHETCACDCEIRKEHCSERHNHENCNCKCENQLEKFQCFEEQFVDKKIWDDNKCECKCREVETCSEGFMWDSKECRCEMVIMPSDMENLLYKRDLLLLDEETD